jgi:hypothetical protein
MWESKGVNIKYEVRDNRNGYKAGALSLCLVWEKQERES